MYKRIALISDLHLDFWVRHYSQKIVYMDGQATTVTADMLYQRILEKCINTNPDLIVFAGDYGNGHENLLVPRFEQSRGCDMVLVPGNHDYYGHKLPDLEYVFNDQLVATTLWTGFYRSRGLETAIYKGISDNFCITGTNVYKVQNLHHNSFELIKQLNREVVITHFAPSNLSIAPWFQGDFYNPYFVNDLDDQIVDLEAKLWLFGHVHHRHSYNIGDCLMVANPCGYPRENYKSFNDYEPVVIEYVNEQWQISKKTPING